MPQKRLWTPPQDARIRRLRGEGASWDAIAAALDVSRNAAIERGRRLGARLPPPVQRRAAAAEPQDPAREPLPPGHPAAWDAITAGTAFAGTPYPHALAGAA
ncbi:AsnC family protein [Limobrevibacterium gyesilva]|uniref:AsnC family protein n=1 Tax=Limobrevibacterium gyesilva TaxID=2991712 RepID=A0AA41YS21_9PROT|nr:AsnC family protein [Limobrevibacterium gyesilva]MCW3477671.1 AsnC family protein [Limobrevibacterium gyesilva]